MKKVFIDARVYRDSTGRYARKLIENLEAMDTDLEFGVLLSKEEIEDYQPKRDNFAKKVADFNKFSFAEQLGFYGFLKKLNAELVHFTMPQHPIRYKKAKIVTIHDLTPLRFVSPDKNRLAFKAKQKVFAHVIKRSVKDAARIVVGTNYVKDDIIKFTGVNPGKIVVTHEAADEIEEAAEPIKNLVSKKFIMYVGRPQPHKNLRRLIDAFKLLQVEKPDLHLVLVGKTDPLYEMHKKYARQKNIKNIVFTGFASEGQLKWLYQNTQAYLFPSLSEGFGLPGLEAMIHSAPVVSSNATCLPEVYGVAAHYFDPEDIEDIKQKISEVLDNPKLRGELISKGRKQVKKYSWRRMAEQTLKVYKSVLED